MEKENLKKDQSAPSGMPLADGGKKKNGHFFKFVFLFYLPGLFGIAHLQIVFKKSKPASFLYF